MSRALVGCHRSKGRARPRPRVIGRHDGDVGEDDVRRAEKQLDDVTHKFTAQVDDLLKHKESELLEV